MSLTTELHGRKENVGHRQSQATAAAGTSMVTTDSPPPQPPKSGLVAGVTFPASITIFYQELDTHLTNW